MRLFIKRCVFIYLVSFVFNDVFLFVTLQIKTAFFLGISRRLFIFRRVPCSRVLHLSIEGKTLPSRIVHGFTFSRGIILYFVLYIYHYRNHVNA